MRRPAIVLTGWVLAALAVSGAPAGGQTVLPVVSVVVSLEVRDPDAWLGMHHEILGTVTGVPKPLVLTVPARTGGSRSITLLEPKFSAAIASARGVQVVRIVVRGKMPGTESLQTLPAFVYSLSEGGSGSGGVKVEYGLSGFAADLIELRLEDR